MPRNILPAVIAGVVAIIVALLKIRFEIRKLREDYRKAIFDRRMAAYSKAWSITDPLSSIKLREAPDPIAVVKSAMSKLCD